MKGHIRPQGDRSWSIVLDIGRDAAGKRHQKWHTAHGTKRDAQKELTRLLNQVESGGYVDSGRLTVAKFLERWLKDYARPNVTARTFQGYESIVREHLTPALGQYRLDKLQPIQIQAYYSTATSPGYRKGGGALSPTTVLQHHRVLREALKHAVRWQILARNPADAVQPPRKAQKQFDALSDERSFGIMEEAKGTRLYVPIVVALGTGMRRGEILAVRWKDVDLNSGVLSVRASLEQTSQGVSVKEPKTAKGRRTVALPAFVVEVLRKHRTEQAKQRLALGSAFDDQGFVCQVEAGGFWHPDTFTAVYRSFARRHGFQGVRFHDLRHTHATQLLSAGVHPKVVQERLGHSTISITMDIYSHVMPGMQEEAAAKLDTLFQAASDAASETAARA
jgi:integrase